MTLLFDSILQNSYNLNTILNAINYDPKNYLNFLINNNGIIIYTMPIISSNFIKIFLPSSLFSKYILNIDSITFSIYVKELISILNIFHSFNTKLSITYNYDNILTFTLLLNNMLNNLILYPIINDYNIIPYIDLTPLINVKMPTNIIKNIFLDFYSKYKIINILTDNKNIIFSNDNIKYIFNTNTILNTISSSYYTNFIQINNLELCSDINFIIYTNLNLNLKLFINTLNNIVEINYYLFPINN